MEQDSKEIGFEISKFTFDKTISLVCASEQFILQVTFRKDSTSCIIILDSPPPQCSSSRRRRRTTTSWTHLLLNAVESDNTFEIRSRHPSVHREESVHRQHLVTKHQMKTKGRMLSFWGPGRVEHQMKT